MNLYFCLFDISGPLVYKTNTSATLFGIAAKVVDRGNSQSSSCIDQLGTHMARVSSPIILDWIHDQIKKFTILQKIPYP